MRIPHRDRVRNPSVLHTVTDLHSCVCVGREEQNGGKGKEGEKKGGREREKEKETTCSRGGNP